jgi:transcriptional regulator with XRE-family HTH domain
MQRFGEKLRKLRKKRKLTLVSLANGLGYTTHSYLSEVEAGKKIPTAQFVLKVARYFEVSTDQLMKDEEEIID